MAKKKSKAKKRLMGKSKRTVAKKKAVKRKSRPAKSSSKIRLRHWFSQAKWNR